jgi:YhcH/YjgK/YiaL family protein
VHVVLQGSELIWVWPAATLTVRQPYDEANDVILYEPPAAAPVMLDLHPGHLVVLQPQDAHMPAVAAAAPARIRKLVFKVSTRLIASGAP